MLKVRLAVFLGWLLWILVIADFCSCLSPPLVPFLILDGFLGEGDTWLDLGVLLESALCTRAECC